ncbi:MAG: RNA methyltransferase [Chitinophagaceae bacterium]|nr:RNA methyltransferase [Chitinophagaceae bacterium]
MLGKSRIKYIQSLGQKKFREETGLFIAEGPKIVNELLQPDITRVTEVYATRDWADANPGLVKKVPVQIVSDQELEKISQLQTPNQVLALVRQYAYQPADCKNGLVLVVCGIQDPGNLGTIIRIADWFAVEQVVCSPDTADMYNPKVVQSTMGSIGRVAVSYTPLLPWLEKQVDCPVYAMMLDGQDITRMPKPPKGILLLGNESRGVPAELLEKADVKVTIPGRGGAESLNAAVAAGILLFHFT